MKWSDLEVGDTVVDTLKGHVLTVIDKRNAYNGLTLSHESRIVKCELRILRHSTGEAKWILVSNRSLRHDLGYQVFKLSGDG